MSKAWQPDLRPFSEKLKSRIERYRIAGGITPGDWGSLMHTCRIADEEFPGHNFEQQLRQVAEERGVVLKETDNHYFVKATIPK